MGLQDRECTCPTSPLSASVGYCWGVHDKIPIIIYVSTQFIGCGVLYVLFIYLTSRSFISVLGHNDAVNKAKVLHRDISAGNILMTETGGILIDWDLSKRLEAEVET